MNLHRGNNFDDFLNEEGILEEVSARAHKHLISLQLSDIMKKSKISKINLAKKMQTSRYQLDRILDPENTAISLESLERIAHALGKKLHIEIA
ncbi:MAG: Fis family transcriptional regulator [Deltaproteobacteria bacterium]|nr:MAG: Fis family transcriptional regulator [Deltaproteobacteria bacterium]